MSSGDIPEYSTSLFSPPPITATTLGTDVDKKKSDGSAVGLWLVGEVSFCLNRLAEASVSASSRNRLLSDTTTSATLLQSNSVKVLSPNRMDQFQQTDVISPPHSVSVSGMNTGDSASQLIDSDAIAIDVSPGIEVGFASLEDRQEEEDVDEEEEEDVDLGVDITLLLPQNKPIALYGTDDAAMLPNSGSWNTTLSSFELIPYLEIAGSNISVLFVKDGKVLDEVNGATTPESGGYRSPVHAKDSKSRAPAADRLAALIGSAEIARKPSALFIVAHAPDVIADILKQVSHQQVADVPMESLVVVVTNRVSEVCTLLPILSALDAPITSSPHQPPPHQPCRRPFVVVDLASITSTTHVPNPQVNALTALLGDRHSCATLVFTSSPSATAGEVDNNHILSNMVGLHSSSKLDYPLRRDVVRTLVAAGGATPTSRSQSGSQHCGNAPQSAAKGLGGSSNIGKPPLAALRYSHNPPFSHSHLTNSHVRANSRDSTTHDWPRSSHSPPSAPLLPPSGKLNRILSVDSTNSNGADGLGVVSSGGARCTVTIVDDFQNRNNPLLLSQSQMTANGILSGTSSVNLMSPSPHFARGSANGSFRRGSSIASDVFPEGVSCKISRCIGHGTFGVVFLGRLRSMPETDVAIKQFYLRTGEEDQFLVDIAYEAALLRCLEHPNIVRYYNSFVSDNCVNIVMQYCNGGNLNLRIGSASLRSEEYLMIMRDILEGIVYLHEHSIMHRDLKPENVLFHDGTLMLADFGTSTKSIETVDGRHEIKGTFAYMAPEVLLGKEYGISCDIWSFGCICADLIGVPLPHRNMDLPAIRLLYNDASDLENPTFNYDPNNRLPKDVRAFFDLCFDMDWKKRGSARLLQECTLIRDPSVITKYQRHLQFGQLAQNSLTSASIAEAKRLTRSMRSNTTRFSGASSLGDVHSAIDGVVLYSVANRSQVVERFLRSGRVSRQNTPIQSAATSDLADLAPARQASPFYDNPHHRPTHHYGRGILGRSGRSELEASFNSGPMAGIRFSRSVASSTGGAGFAPAYLPKPRLPSGRNPNSQSRGLSASNTGGSNRNDVSRPSSVVASVVVPGIHVGHNDLLYGSGTSGDEEGGGLGGGADNTDTHSDVFRSHDVNEEDGGIWFPASQLLGDNTEAAPNSPLSPLLHMSPTSE
jgi:serine/threonine protein kinase